MIIKKQTKLSFSAFMKIRQQSFASMMTCSIFSFLVLITMLVSTATKVFSQTNWTRDVGNPVLDFGPSGSWDDQSAGMGSVLFDGTIYHMWYGGYDGTNFRIGHATSPDGISWAKDILNPVLNNGSPGSWDDHFVYLPCVILVGSTFHMWYAGNDGSIERIGHAMSSDGVTWTKDAVNPVLDVGASGSWDDVEVFPMAGSVIFDGSVYHMWFGGVVNSPPYNYAIGYATSPDGTNWTKNTNNPVMVRDLSNGWDRHGVVPGTVLFDGTSYHAWYSGHGGDYRYRVGYATSTDGVNWNKDILNNPVLDFGPSGNWDFNQAWNGSVLFDTVTHTYKMWYAGGPFFSERMGYAISLINGIDDNILTDLPQRFALSQNYPNPFNPSTRISYSIPNSGFITLKVYDILGKEIQTLVNEFQNEGTHYINFNANSFSSGIYFYKLQSGKEFVEIKKMLYVK